MLRTCLASPALTKIHEHPTHNLSANQMHRFELGEITKENKTKLMRKLRDNE